REVLAAVLLRPADAEPAVAADPADQRLVLEVLGLLGAADARLDLGGHEVGEVRAQLELQRLLVAGQVDVHGPSARGRSVEPVLPQSVSVDPRSHASRTARRGSSATWGSRSRTIVERRRGS